MLFRTFYLSKNAEDKEFQSSITVFNCDNKKCFLNTPNQHIRRFLKGHVTLKIGVMADCHHRNKIHFKIYLNRKPLFEIVAIFHNIEIVLLLVYLGKHNIT